MVCSPQRNKGGGRRPGDIRGGEYAVALIPPETMKFKQPHHAAAFSAAFNARFKSSIKSAGSSSPIDNRIVP
ncbi:hypothetical protein BH11PSE13_BH11PSE13_36810 [soil metagenome]